jgi:hypothetical protein
MWKLDLKDKCTHNYIHILLYMYVCAYLSIHIYIERERERESERENRDREHYRISASLQVYYGEAGKGKRMLESETY